MTDEAKEKARLQAYVKFGESQDLRLTAPREFDWIFNAGFDAGRASQEWLDKQKLVESLLERQSAVAYSLMGEFGVSQVEQYLEGQIYQLKRLIEDVNFGCFDPER